MYYTYVLKSEVSGKHYIGSTSDLGKRIKRHNSGQNRSTKDGIPWKVVYSECFASRQQAYKREIEIKSYKGGQAFKKLIGI